MREDVQAIEDGGKDDFHYGKDWVDPEGYRRFVAGQRRAFEDEVDLELGAPKPGAKSGEVKPAAGTGR